MLKKWAVWLLALLIPAFLAGCGSTGGSGNTAAENTKTVKLGIIQIVEHPALDAARKGFLDELAKNGYQDGKNLQVDFQNAQGDQSNLQTIARKFVQDKKDLILAIATPSAIAMANETKDIPILITAVTDPVQAKLVKSMAKPDTNVTGTTDMNPVKEQLQLIKDLVPAAKRVGVIYNSSEVNSQVQVKVVKKDAPSLGLTVVEAPITASSEVMQGAQSLVGRVDAIYVPTDNTVVSAISGVIGVAEKNKLPVIAGESNTVEQGALGTIGIDYYKLGAQTADMAIRVLKGEKPHNMPIESQKELRLVLNAREAAKIGLTIPASLQKKAAQIIK
ncbi:ABC transporter substrate-binding protein [Desulfotomaculum copahuensis]|uniref:ABC transporter substrate-binding protein n=1 Tax=Desulfotomaculum copahuensis TaxID=1838280 RepID=A0A1B7LHM9_9FIRM|nr:ABC transporter substrate-binding protein [Desulfotomaculum copahuensis]OAT85806.1 ABC transporter substrate-binding protein [Desulfotomaculum copahuensis]